VGTALILEETDTDRNNDDNSRFSPFMETHIKHIQVSAIEKFQATKFDCRSRGEEFGAIYENDQKDATV
jgi:hypothetical protein